MRAPISEDRILIMVIAGDTAADAEFHRKRLPVGAREAARMGVGNAGHDLIQKMLSVRRGGQVGIDVGQIPP